MAAIRIDAVGGLPLAFYPHCSSREFHAAPPELRVPLYADRADGTTHLRFDAVALLARLAVLVPRPRINLVLYYGILAPRAPWRATVVASAGSA